MRSRASARWYRPIAPRGTRSEENDGTAATRRSSRARRAGREGARPWTGTSPARSTRDGRPGFLVAVARGGRVAHLTTYGHRDVAAGLPVEPDTLWRIYSMTKPVTAVAALLLMEEGLLALDDPVARYLPEFADARVHVEGSGEEVRTRPAAGPIRIRHLMTHTAGLTFAFYHAHPVDALYRTPVCTRRWRPAPTWHARSRCTRGCRSSSNRARSGTTRWPATCWAGSSRWCRHGRWTSSSPSGSSGRSACRTPSTRTSSRNTARQ
ncbi:hypothetical protein SGLAM104S_04641 [Streptomyces glaucescens]